MTINIDEKTKNKMVVAFVVAVGLLMAGFFPGYYYYKTYKTNNSVTVKGLSEMNVRADLAVWNIKFTVAGNDMAKVQSKLGEQTGDVVAYLRQAGFEDVEMTIPAYSLIDKLAERYASDNIPTYRYIASQKMTVKSKNVDLVAKSASNISMLGSKGILFEVSEYSSPVSYLFTDLNSVKPKMLEEATKNAKESAEEFAKASGSKVGRIRRASQGVFSILPQDEVGGSETEFINKKIRVVSTIEYWLE